MGGATDTVCKKWKKCDKNSMIVIEPGTSENAEVSSEAALSYSLLFIPDKLKFIIWICIRT